MDFFRQIEQMARAIAQVVFHKKADSGEITEANGGGYTDNLRIVLLQKIENLDFCGAEDLLFEQLSSRLYEDLTDLAEEIYNKIASFPDEVLLEHNFPREEIDEGRARVEKFYEEREKEQERLAEASYRSFVKRKKKR